MNHYAFGCVVDWMMRRLAGLVPAAPGYRATLLAPDLDGPLDSVSAHVDTPYGRLAIAWRRDGDAASIDVQVPVGVDARLEPPDGWTPAVPRLLPGGHHRVTVARGHR